MVDLLKLAVAGRCSCSNGSSKEALADVLLALGTANVATKDMILELCVTELEDVATDTERLKSVPQPVVQESSHPYTHDAMQSGQVRIPGAEALRVEFDRACSTERRHDPLTIMDGTGRIISIRSGRETSDWVGEVRVLGDELKWKFNSGRPANYSSFSVYPFSKVDICFCDEQGIFLSTTSKTSRHVGIGISASIVCMGKYCVHCIVKYLYSNYVHSQFWSTFFILFLSGHA